jgi:hypothetical protein
MKANYDLYMCRVAQLDVQSSSFSELSLELRKRNTSAPTAQTKEPSLLQFIGRHKDVLKKTEFHLVAESVLLDDETVWAGHDNDGLITQLWVTKQ